jgi:homoserine kinase
MISKVYVRVPGAIGNAGSGFDSAGISIQLYNEFLFERTGCEKKPAGRNRNSAFCETNLAFRVFSETLQNLIAAVPDVRLSISGNVPEGKGLGSSGTAVIAGLVAAYCFSGKPVKPEEILIRGKAYEGHLDDIAASFFGGFVMVAENGGHVFWATAKVPPYLRAVFFISESPFPTKKARRIIPPKIPLQDAVYNLQRYSFLAAAFLNKKRLSEFLPLGTQDRIHQPYRSQLYPHFSPLCESAIAHGAIGCCISGAGPSIVAFSIDRPEKIAAAWRKLVEKKHLRGEVKILALGGKTTWKVSR